MIVHSGNQYRNQADFQDIPDIFDHWCGDVRAEWWESECGNHLIREPYDSDDF